MKKEIENYYYELLDDYLFFSPNIEEDINVLQNVIKDKKHISSLNKRLMKIYEKSIYPAFIKQNIDKLLDFLIENADLKDKAFLEVNKISNSRKFNLEIDNSYEIYTMELKAKYDQLETYLEHPYQAIKEQDIIESIRFDFLVFQSYYFSSKDYNRYLPNLVNHNYILSIKKFLIDIPSLFNNPTIKKRTIDNLTTILEKTKDDKQIKEINKIIEDVEKRRSNKTVIVDLEGIYLLLLTKKILVTDKPMRNSLTESDYYLDYLKTFILDYDFYISEEKQNKMLKFLNSLLDINDSYDKKAELNMLIYRFSHLVCPSKEDINDIEYNGKMTTWEIITDKIYHYKMKDIIPEMKLSIDSDFDYLNGILSSEEEFTKLLKNNYFKHPYFTYMMQYLLNLQVCLFQNEFIFNRIKRILEYQLNQPRDHSERHKIKTIQKKIEKKRG